MWTLYIALFLAYAAGYFVAFGQWCRGAAEYPRRTPPEVVRFCQVTTHDDGGGVVTAEEREMLHAE